MQYRDLTWKGNVGLTLDRNFLIKLRCVNSRCLTQTSFGSTKVISTSDTSLIILPLRENIFTFNLA